MHRFAPFLLVAGCATGASTVEPGEIDAAATTDARVSDDASDGIVDAATNDGAAIDGASIDAASIDAASIDASTVDGGIDAPPGGPTDTCAQAVDLTAQAGGSGVTVNGTTVGYANDVSLPLTGCTGYTTAGPDAIYRVDLTAGQTLTATGDPTTTWDLSLLVVTPCALTPTCLIGDDSGFAGTTEMVTYTATAAISVYVVVDGYTSNITGPYALTVRVQ